jgi:hypothetical protein
VADDHANGYLLGMNRRRLILAACVAVVAIGAAWSLFSDQLTPEEQQIVGIWRYHQPVSGRWTNTLTLSPDRRYWDMPVYQPKSKDRPPDGTWAIRNGDLIVDLERSAIRRTLRPLCNLVRVRVAPTVSSPLASISADEVVTVMPDGTRVVWTRDRGD